MGDGVVKGVGLGMFSPYLSPVKGMIVLGRHCDAQRPTSAHKIPVVTKIEQSIIDVLTVN